MPARLPVTRYLECLAEPLHERERDEGAVKVEARSSLHQQALHQQALRQRAGLHALPTQQAAPSWYIVGKKDFTVHPDLERAMAKRMGATTHEFDSSHVPMLSQPKRVLDVIRTAANAVQRSAASARDLGYGRHADEEQTGLH